MPTNQYLCCDCGDELTADLTGNPNPTCCHKCAEIYVKQAHKEMDAVRSSVNYSEPADSLQGCRESDRITEGLSANGKPVFTRRLLNQPLTLTYDIVHPGEREAGLRAYSEQVTVTVDSGDPGGSHGEFAEEMQGFLSEWFDGAAVRLRPANLPKNRYPMANQGKIVYVSVPED